jgi:hypothetical protein
MAQTISPMLFSQNYWMPDRAPFTGKLQDYWNEIEESGLKFMRIGGKDYDKNLMWSYLDLNSIITELRNHGIEPIIQVPIDPAQDVLFNAARCSLYVDEINNISGRNVVYWAIGNEPDGSYSPDFDDASEIQSYIQAVSTAMKDADPTSKLLVPA